MPRCRIENGVSSLPTHNHTYRRDSLLSQLRPSAGKAKFSAVSKREKSRLLQTCPPLFCIRRERELADRSEFSYQVLSASEQDGKGAAASGPVHHCNIFFFVRFISFLPISLFYFEKRKNEKNIKDIIFVCSSVEGEVKL